MVKNLRFTLLCFLFFSNSIFPYEKPNIVIIVSDDLGWGDVSYHGSTIPTPNIDRFVNEGLELNRFYSNPICSPTRASLMTGLGAYSVGILSPIGNPSIT
ncbi:MAG: sulfatase-like hydrolase/transferase, partial [Gammaproteobacteria bacterium]